MGERRDRLRAIICDAMTARAEGRFDEAGRHFDTDATWRIVGQGEIGHRRVRGVNDRPLSVRTPEIAGTIAEGGKVTVEARGAMAPTDRRIRWTSDHIAGDRGARMPEYPEMLVADRCAEAA